LLIIEILLFYILHTNLADDRIDEVLENLLARGNTHAEVLESSHQEATFEHVGIMESASDLAVVVTDSQGNVIVTSNPIDDEIKNLLSQYNNQTIPAEGQVIEDQWHNERYIASASPININGAENGKVFMFADTNDIKRVVDQLNDQFIVAGIITITFTVITILVLSRLITSPLISIKYAAEQLSMGEKGAALNTDRKDELGELARSISKLSDDLERLKQERHEFLASISHELRTPLTNIKGYADIINRQDMSEAEVREYPSIIREETEHLSLLIKHLFELAKMDQNKFVIELMEMPLYDLMHTAAVRISPVMAEASIHFTVNYPPKDVMVYADSERFQQVLLNILDNARKHVCNNGEVNFQATQTEEAVYIAVTDNGEGIPEEDLPHIFDRLYQVEKSRSRESGGSGLGLAIAKEIVASHGGTIQINSEQGKGTSVMIKLKRGDENA